MFVKLPTIVLVAVTATLSLGAPTPEGDGLSLRAANPQIEGYPNCGAPICKRDGSNIELLNGAEAIAVRSEEERQLERRTSKCAWKNCHIHPPYVRIEYPGGRCGCAPQGHIPPGAKIAHRTLDLTSSEELQERDVQTAEVIGLDLTNHTAQVEQGEQIDCEKRLKCPPWGHPEKRYNRCFCINNKFKLKLERDTSSLEQRSTPKLQSRNPQYDMPTGDEPLDCASIAKCPGGQHPVNNASDGMCECVNDDTPNTGMPDCASIAKCPGDQHAVFNNSLGMCQCIPLNTQLDCDTIAKCADGAHPMNYMGNCICVPDVA